MGQDFDIREFAFELDADGNLVPERTEEGLQEPPSGKPDGSWFLLCGDGQRCPRCPAHQVASEPVGTQLTACHTVNRHLRFCRVSHVDERRVVVKMLEMSAEDFAAAQNARIEALSVQARLSGRECEVLEQLLLGGSTVEIAEELSISPRTVKFHQRNLLTKLGADSRADLLRVLR